MFEKANEDLENQLNVIDVIKKLNNVEMIELSDTSIDSSIIPDIKT